MAQRIAAPQRVCRIIATCYNEACWRYGQQGWRCSVWCLPASASASTSTSTLYRSTRPGWSFCNRVLLLGELDKVRSTTHGDGDGSCSGAYGGGSGGHSCHTHTAHTHSPFSNSPAAPCPVLASHPIPPHPLATLRIPSHSVLPHSIPSSPSPSSGGNRGCHGGHSAHHPIPTHAQHPFPVSPFPPRPIPARHTHSNMAPPSQAQPSLAQPSRSRPSLYPYTPTHPAPPDCNPIPSVPVHPIPFHNGMLSLLYGARGDTTSSAFTHFSIHLLMGDGVWNKQGAGPPRGPRGVSCILEPAPLRGRRP